MGLIQRAIEAADIATISITLSEEITEKVRPPRALSPGFPLGHPMGYPGKIQSQLQILRLLLKLLEELDVPGSIVACDLTSVENFAAVKTRFEKKGRFYSK